MIKDVMRLGYFAPNKPIVVLTDLFHILQAIFNEH